MEEKEKIYCFDFDGTLTTHDTLIEIIRYHAGSWKLLWGFLLYSPILVLMKLHLYPNWKAKQLIFTHFFGGMQIETFNCLCKQFAKSRQSLLRPHMIDLIRQALEARQQVFIVSASIDNWVRPFFDQQGIVGLEVIGTEVETHHGLLTGRFSTPNCYGEEKVRRISQALTITKGEAKPVVVPFDRTHYYIVAYGDSRGDKQMLAFADEGYLVKQCKNKS